MHIECPISGLQCKTCLNQCFKRIFGQMKTLKKLVLRTDDIHQALVDQLNCGQNLKHLNIYSSKSDLFKIIHDNWLIRQIVIAFEEMSQKSMSSVFKLGLPKETVIVADSNSYTIQTKNLVISATLENTIKEYYLSV